MAYRDSTDVKHAEWYAIIGAVNHEGVIDCASSNMFN